ncbi:hypothetical protein NVP1170O_058 [Vibrio phage 1.170.O._10N.261.52.C3]|nr:hypothetical protein NVP1170O_058 [Vibrio phage 1.170.O._10N.261.52.C3]
MKTCNTCGKSKDCSEFHKRKASNDGLAAKCKSCQREYDKARVHKPDRVKARKDYYDTHKDSKEYKESRHKSTQKYREKYSKKYKAHCEVNNALRDGILTKKTCEVCGCSNTAGHHDDYDHPLIVRWLCQKHHIEWHLENGEGINPV